jgi:hypothetical protein
MKRHSLTSCAALLAKLYRPYCTHSCAAALISGAAVLYRPSSQSTVGPEDKRHGGNKND